MQAAQASGEGQQVTFAVTLPGDSANSLVVTQPNSPSVHQQVAGWFITQMASRGVPQPPTCCRLGLLPERWQLQLLSGKQLNLLPCSAQ